MSGSKIVQGLISDPSDVTAPAFAQENIYGSVIFQTLNQIKEDEARRQAAEGLPQNELKSRHTPNTNVLTVDYAKGGVINGKS